MKKNNAWAKTLLSIYRYLDRLADTIDKIVIKSGLNSCNIVGQNYFYNNIMTLSQKIIDLSERKVRLINIKVLVDEILREIPLCEAKILIEKYLNGMRTKDIIEKYNISSRTIFRRVENALKSFSSLLIAKGFSDFKLKTMLRGEEWILNVYKKFESSLEEDFYLPHVFFAKVASM